MRDESTYGFNKADAEALIEKIGLRDEVSGRRGNNRSARRGSSVRLYRFTLNANLNTGTADADILQMDGTDTTLDEDVLDPLGIFDTLVNGDPGICVLQGGAYYVIQAPCSGSGGLIDGGAP